MSAKGAALAKVLLNQTDLGPENEASSKSKAHPELSAIGQVPQMQTAANLD